MDDFGGPVWHASARGKNRRTSRQIALDALRGVGDRALGQWESDGVKEGVVHVQRRLSDDERERFDVPEPIDIRGTTIETRRKRQALSELVAAGIL